MIKMPIQRGSIYTILLFLLMAGCSTDPGAQDDAIKNPVVLDLYGKWQSECVSDGGDSFTVSMSVREEHLTYTRTHFENTEECDSLNQTLQVSFTYAASGAVLRESPEGSKTLDLKMKWATAKSSSPQQVQDFNSREVCGIKDWRRFEKVFISGHLCHWNEGEQGVAIADTGAMRYDFYTLTGSPQQLAIGNVFSSDPSPQAGDYDQRLRFVYFGP